MTDEKRPNIGEGIKSGLGVLLAFKEAVEETLEEALQRGDLSQERAREVMRDASGRIQQIAEETRDRLDLVPRREFDELKREVEALRSRLDALAGTPPALPTTPPAEAAGGTGGPDSFPVD